MKTFSSTHPITLVLPALYSEFRANAMRLIREELCKVDYLTEIVVALGPADERQFCEALDFAKRAIVAPAAFSHPRSTS